MEVHMNKMEKYRPDGIFIEIITHLAKQHKAAFPFASASMRDERRKAQRDENLGNFF
jgi:hypothetical protein